MAERKKIAAVLTWYIPGSHSDVLVGKFLPGRGIALDDGFHELRVDLVSIYIDQAPTQRNGGDAGSNDIGLGLAADHGVEVYVRSAALPTPPPPHPAAEPSLNSRTHSRRSARRCAATTARAASLQSMG